MPGETRGPGQRLNFGPPSVPRPAASVVLLREPEGSAGVGLEVLLLKRSQEAKFMPGVWVFPGGAVGAGDGEGEAGVRACAIRELAEEAGIDLPPAAELVLFSRWITPELVSTRFDAQFYLASAPSGARARADGTETTSARWFRPQDALDAEAAGEIGVAFPTVSQLRTLASFHSRDEALAAHRDLAVEPVLPKIVEEAGSRRILLPGDPDYPE